MAKTDWAERIYRGRKKAYEEGLARGVELGIDQGVTLEQERILDAFYAKRRQLEQLVLIANHDGLTENSKLFKSRIIYLDSLIEAIKGE
jgi:flagellar biosynthesis/type III secretory pathway protein FliH